MNFSFFFVEMVSLVLFFLGLLEAKKKNTSRLLEIGMIFIYGLLLEELDMRIFKSYHYGSGFFFRMGHVPVCIAWLWTVILASSMVISDRVGLPEPIRPFFDALLAVWIDLSIDAIAIRVGYWSWVIPLNEGWFGVPAGNLYAWMWVAFCYSALARIVRRLIRKNEKWKWTYLTLPVFAYAGLFIAMMSIGTIGKTLGFVNQQERLYIFWTQFLVFALIVLASTTKRRASDERVAFVWWGSRFAIHLYFLFAFVFYGLYRNIPVLGVIALFTLGGELMLHRKIGAVFLILFSLTISTSAWALQDSTNPKDWYDRAGEDLDVAQLVSEKTAHYGEVCFLAQQAVEKSLKGVLIENGIQPTLSHSTAKLLAEVSKFRSELSPYSDDCRMLDRLFFPSRYPKVGLSVTKENASACLEKSKPILETIIAKKATARNTDSN